MKIILSTLNTSYLHTAFGLRYLKANLNEFSPQCEIIEYTTERPLKDIALDLLSYNPDVIGFGVYIWNVEYLEKLVSLIKKISPQTLIVLGGPEVSYESATQKIVQFADYTICGEADFQFYNWVKAFSDNQLFDKYPHKIIAAQLPDIQKIKFPYSLISDSDLSHRYVYVEASRGCPYKCEYCLSSLDKSVRNFDLESFLNEMEKLILRGAKHFKFIDRTFNLSPTFCTSILNFFLKYQNQNLFLHFEMVPDRLPGELKTILTQFTPGSVQFEVGIQTLNLEVSKNISRKNDLKKSEENFKFLARETHIHVHADLIVGLPGETLQSFGEGFNQLFEFGPSEIQVGILKRLKGTPIVRHEKDFEMVYQDFSPYNILQTKHISFYEVQKMEKFAKYWDILWNSGHYKSVLSFWFQCSQNIFQTFFDFTIWISERLVQSNSPSLLSWVDWLFKYSTEILHFDSKDIAEKIIYDYSVRGKRDIPRSLQQWVNKEQVKNQSHVQIQNKNPLTPSRQARHLN